MTESVYAFKRAEGDGIVGDALVEIGPEHPDYDYWKKYWERERRWLEQVLNEGDEEG